MGIQTITPLINQSAMEFWKGKMPNVFGYNYKKRILCDLPSEYQVSSKEAVWVSELLGLKLPLSLYSGFVNQHHTGINYKSYFQKVPLPKRCFFEIPDMNIYVASPELTFLQGARYLDFASLVRLGFDLCAQYYVDDSTIYGQSSRIPITTPEHIRNFINGCPPMRGSKKAERAAFHILGLSNSPMESTLAVILCLPMRLGGYGLDGMEMNGYIELSARGRRLVGRSGIRGDLVWRQNMLALEYNSKTAHNTDAAFYNDSNRTTALKDSGWKCIAVTPSNIKSFEAMENLAGIIRKQLGLRPNEEVLSKYKSKRREVYEELFGGKATSKAAR